MGAEGVSGVVVEAGLDGLLGGDEEGVAVASEGDCGGYLLGKVDELVPVDSLHDGEVAVEGVAEGDDAGGGGEGFVRFLVGKDELLFVLDDTGFGHDVVGQVRDDETREVKIGVTFCGQGLPDDFLVQVQPCWCPVSGYDPVSVFHDPYYIVSLTKILLIAKEKQLRRAGDSPHPSQLFLILLYLVTGSKQWFHLPALPYPTACSLEPQWCKPGYWPQCS